MRRTLLMVPVGAAILLALAGCSAAAGGGSSTADRGVPQSSRSDQSAGVDSKGAAPDQAGGAGGTAASADRSIVVTGTLGLVVDAPLDAAAKADALVSAAGGRVDSRDERAASDHEPASATLTVRVPAAQFDRVVAKLKRLGSHPDYTTTSADVTTQVEDLDARIHALQGTIARFEQLSSTATTTTDLLKIEEQIGQRQGELESLQAQQRGLRDQVSMSTLTLTLTAPGVAVPRTGPQDFGSAVATGWAVFVGALTAVLLALGVMLPWLVLGGLIAAVVVWLVRRRRRLAAARAATAPSTP